MHGSFHIALGIVALAILVPLCGFIGTQGEFVATRKDHPEVDLELVLAVDTSRSMNAAKLKMQREGYVNAFRSRDLMRSVESGRLGRIAVLYMEWAGAGHQIILGPWTVIDKPEDASSYASFLAAQPLNQPVQSNTGTSISGGLLFAQALFAGRQHETRQIIDISGDGVNNSGVPVAPVRDALLARGITINGLPIALPRDGLPVEFPLLNPQQLELYYENCVIGGPGAFAIVMDDISRFDEIIERKLTAEIMAHRPRFDLATASAASKQQFDCAIVGDRPGR